MTCTVRLQSDCASARHKAKQFYQNVQSSLCPPALPLNPKVPNPKPSAHSHLPPRTAPKSRNFKIPNLEPQPRPPYHKIPVYAIYFTTLYHIIPYYAILYYAMLYYTMLCYTIPYYTILYYTILYHNLLHCIVPHSTMPYDSLTEPLLKAEPLKP